MLLFANLAFLAWSQWIDVPATAMSGNGSSRLPRLALASEAAEAGEARVGPEAQAPARSLSAPAGPCLSVGPFDEADGATRGAELLRKKGFGVRSRPEAASGQEGYWVYLPGIASDAAAAQSVRRLTEHGFRDASALQFAAGELRVNIGFFTIPAQANLRQLQIRKLGLKADIAERRLPETLYWVDVAARPSVLPAQDIYKGPNLRIGARPCPEGTPPPQNGPGRPGERPSSRNSAMAEVTAKP